MVEAHGSLSDLAHGSIDTYLLFESALCSCDALCTCGWDDDE